MRAAPALLVLPLLAAGLAGAWLTAQPVPLPLPGPTVAEPDEAVFHTLVCPGPTPERPLERCNVRATATNGPANEIDLALDPADPDHLVVVGKAYPYHRNVGQSFLGQVNTAYATTFDGGATWTGGWLQPVDALLELPLLGPVGSTPTSESDPVVDFDADGGLYASTLRVGDGAGLPIYRSEDGGLTWSEVGLAYEGSTDKQWQVTDPLTGNLYLVTLDPGDGQDVVVSRDGGFTWGAPVSACLCSSAAIDVGPDGEVYVIGRRSGQLVFTKSLDEGLTWTPQQALAPDRGGGSNPTNGRLYRTPQIPVMAVDRTNDIIYAVWGDHPANSTLGSLGYRGGPDEDIWLARSDDRGATWSAPVRINDDEGDLAHQFMPAVAVSPRGDVHVAWFDQRHEPSGLTIQVYYAHSSNGLDWGPNLLVSDAPFLAALSHHQSATPVHTGLFVGDYIGLQASDDRAVVAFPDTRYGRSDVFIATIR